MYVHLYRRVQQSFPKKFKAPCHFGNLLERWGPWAQHELDKIDAELDMKLAAVEQNKQHLAKAELSKAIEDVGVRRAKAMSLVFTQNPLSKEAMSYCHTHAQPCKCFDEAEQRRHHLRMCVGGHTCLDASGMGQGLGLNGPSVRVVLAYLHERRVWQEDIFLDECVLQWADWVTEYVLGDLYMLTVFNGTPEFVGVPLTRWRSQIK